MLIANKTLTIIQKPITIHNILANSHNKYNMRRKIRKGAWGGGWGMVISACLDLGDIRFYNLIKLFY
jgi:hypothetical protein